ncbi:hypothetical protein DFA_07209 [Cavenderia fasciculata]|uniref:Large ribosomal subunit protein bL32m n=1 Tax=Cavenderia fasciculata TaxID=261658 RepID=F4PVS8_CACFS|nr:uncharacterized protein DFA_07209 [Cavenderia fasciculata]EGG20092.1 hypothetical protein DFA_07209 [Cavenderia fasciculata]|eukprot:XP_004367075.1 hypothetical protein DFA_07209 [Cavenderia fasciculata]
MQRSLLGSMFMAAAKPRFATATTSYYSQYMNVRNGFLYRPTEQQQQQQQQVVIPEQIEQDVEQDLELMAVPKKRVSYTRNRKRNSAADKKHENIHHHTVCPKCNSLKLRHHLYPNGGGARQAVNLLKPPTTKPPQTTKPSKPSSGFTL